MTAIPTHAMILAAGLGMRMRPLTLTLPKPLLPVAGRTMLDRVLDHLDAVGCVHRVVNIHWLPDALRAHLAGRPNITLSAETELLDTGGGIARALPWLGERAFYACNADIVWRDGNSPALARLAAAWEDRRMDALLLLQPTAGAFGYDGAGDFLIDGEGRLSRRPPGGDSPFLFAGVQILHPRLFAAAPPGPFSLNLLYDRAAAAGRLYGLVHDGAWYHIGTPAALAEASVLLAGS